MVEYVFRQTKKSQEMVGKRDSICFKCKCEGGRQNHKWIWSSEVSRNCLPAIVLKRLRNQTKMSSSLHCWLGATTAVFLVVTFNMHLAVSHWIHQCLHQLCPVGLQVTWSHCDPSAWCMTTLSWHVAEKVFALFTKFRNRFQFASGYRSPASWQKAKDRWLDHLRCLVGKTKEVCSYQDQFYNCAQDNFLESSLAFLTHLSVLNPTKTMVEKHRAF